MAKMDRTRARSILCRCSKEQLMNLLIDVYEDLAQREEDLLAALAGVEKQVDKPQELGAIWASLSDCYLPYDGVKKPEKKGRKKK